MPPEVEGKPIVQIMRDYELMHEKRTAPLTATTQATK
jgi:hypothetical protein